MPRADHHCAFKGGGDLAKAATLYNECAGLWGVSLGADHAQTQGAKADAARVQAAAMEAVGGGSHGTRVVL